MVPLDYMLAVAVLLSSTHSENPPALDEHTCLAPSLVALALNWELLDPRESRLFFARPDDFASDVQLIQNRYAQLVDAPPAADAMRFPGVEAACEMLRFNRTYFAHLQKQRDLLGENTSPFGVALAETDQLYRVWDLVRDANSHCYYVSVRRQALGTLRQTLGARDYYTAQLPPHVPIWRFSRHD